MPHVVPPSHSKSFHITDDRSRIDVPRILELYADTWWAKGRIRDDVTRALEHSHPVVTAWDGDLLVGFTRVISDLTFRATIWDVIVRASHRERGIGRDMVRFVLEHPDLSTVTQFFLLTADKHRFYERLGFKPERDTAMMLRR